MDGVREPSAKIYGLQDKLASVRAVEIPVLELEDDRERLVVLHWRMRYSSPSSRMEPTAMLFGCTGMIGSGAGGGGRTGAPWLPRCVPVP